MLYTRVLFLVLPFTTFPGFGQTSNYVFGADYSLPIPIKATPGQILNLFVQGVGSGLTQRVAASGYPLPKTLAGISVEMRQLIGPSPVSVPLLAVAPVGTCVVNGPTLGSAPCGRYTVVTVQMPFELNPPCLQCASAIVNLAQLIVSENGLAGGAIDVTPTTDQIHVGNGCDLDIGATFGCAPVPLVTHADGSLVSQTNPAKLGEQVVMYALGLGLTNPAVPTGQATPSPAPTTRGRFEVNFAFEPNASPSKGLVGTSVPTVCSTTPICIYDPAFSGLTPGFAGLYQVNFVIPSAAPEGLPPCGPSGVASNLTLTIVGSTSFDGAGICVAIPTSGTVPTSSGATDQAASRVPLGSLLPNTIWFPIRPNLTGLGQALPPISIEVPGQSRP